MTFAFYDFETTGTSPEYDQPLQFAAILTDDNFNTLKKINIRCKLSPHILPAPFALVVTRIKPDQLSDSTLPSWFEFTQKIRQIINDWAPTTWVGYNNLRFDEEFLRQSFYQNLQPNLYETQSHGNDRLDILSAVYAVWERSPSILNWVSNSTGNPIYKLDKLAPANGFKKHNAHNALGDVEATIHIARCIRDGDFELWREILSNRDKRTVFNKLQSFEPLDLIDRFGSSPPQTFTGCLCGVDNNYTNRIGFFDLKLADPADYVDADDETIKKAVSISPKIIRSISINKVPNIFQTRQNNNRFIKGAELIANRKDFQKRVAQVLSERYLDKEPEAKTVERKIYDTFYSAHDKTELVKFQNANGNKRLEIVTKLQDSRLQQLGRRLLVLERMKAINEQEQKMLKEYLQKKWTTPKEERPSWTTFESAAQQMAEIKENRLISTQEIKALEDFYRERFNAILKD